MAADTRPHEPQFNQSSSSLHYTQVKVHNSYHCWTVNFIPTLGIQELPSLDNRKLFGVNYWSSTVASRTVKTQDSANTFLDWTILHHAIKSANLGCLHSIVNRKKYKWAAFISLPTETAKSSFPFRQVVRGMRLARTLKRRMNKNKKMSPTIPHAPHGKLLWRK